MQIFKNNELAEVTHHNRGKRPHNVPLHEQLFFAVQFIKNYAEASALYLPGRQGTQFRICELLPVSCSKKTVYEKYAKCVNSQQEFIPISLGLFRRLWSQCCSDIIISKPKTDLCVKCQKFYTSTSDLLGKDIEEKQQFIKDCQAYLSKVDQERSYYKEVIAESIQMFEKSGLMLESHGHQPSNLYDGVIHISFYYAQKV